MDAIEIIYLIGFVIITGLRKYYTGKFKPDREQIKKDSTLDKILLGLIGIAMLLPLLSIWINLFSFADYIPIKVVQWTGLAIFIMSIYLLDRSHSDLGKNWNSQVAINEKQNLIKIGVYKDIRHPMYTAHLLWGIGNALVFANWIVGPAMLITIILFLPQRIKREEKLLMKEFGDEYEDYMKKTGALISKL
jgi:protein-S-isoprenylcysteine O-methyltransferase Ste14